MKKDVCSTPDDDSVIRNDKTVQNLGDKGQLMGLISSGDVGRLLIEDLNLLLTNVEKYILGIG